MRKLARLNDTQAGRQQHYIAAAILLAGFWLAIKRYSACYSLLLHPSVTLILGPDIIAIFPFQKYAELIVNVRKCVDFYPKISG